MDAIRRFVLLTLPALCLVLGGCSNPWRESYVANPAFREVEFERTPGVTIRRVEPERLGEYHEAARERALSRDLPVDEWPEEWQLEEKRAFLRALRVTEGPREVFYIGSSAFTYPGTLNLHDGRLEEFARKIGADYAVVAENYVGLRDKVVYSPVTTTVYGGFGYPHRHHRHWYSDFTFYTTYVPTVVAVDSYHYIAYFLRETTPEEFVRVRERAWGD